MIGYYSTSYIGFSKTYTLYYLTVFNAINWRARHSQVCSIENRDIYVVCVIVRMSLLPFDLN